jgi:hypothetical protein
MSSASSVGFLLVLVLVLVDEALVDLIDNHTPPYFLKDKRSAAVTVIDGNEEAEPDCDDGSDHDEADYDAADDNDWVCAPGTRHSKTRNTTSYFFHWNCWKVLSE